MRSVVREELAGKVHKNDPSVFRRLDIDRISNELVDSCAEMSAHQNEEPFDDLESVVAAAARSRVRKSDHTAQLDARAKGDGWEVKMYPPLQRLCNYIVNFSHASEPKATRNITIAANRQLKGEEYTTGFPRVSPDGTGSCVPECDFWIDVDWFVEIKAREDQGVVAKDTTISEVVCQAADYARLHLSSRPFQLFSIALLLFGHKFGVGIFDRDGVSLSPIFDFCDGGIGFKTFIKVVRRLVSPRLSDIDLGRDPTAIPLRDSPDLHNDIRNLAVTLGVSPDFPPHLVLCPMELSTMEHGAASTKWFHEVWVTIGPPIWVSLSLIGRGTNIWRVIRVTMKSGNWQVAAGASISILKNSWRFSDRTGEAFIYGSLNGHPPGVARFLQGGDTVFPDTQMTISVHNLRSHYPFNTLLVNAEANGGRGDRSAPGTARTAILHRLILQTIGRPLWHFVNYLELLRAFRAAVVDHQQLVTYGILHRDISAGNIMISASHTPSPGEEGFLMDLEFARINQVVHVTRIPGGPEHTIWSTPRRGVQMTGTVQFMAREILESIVNNNPIQHTESHDLESFAWVFAYTVLRRLLRESEDETNTMFSKDDRITVKKLHDESFGVYSNWALDA